MCYAACLTEGKPYPLISQGFCVRELVAENTRNVREKSLFHGQNPGMSTTAVQSGTVHGLDLSVSANNPCPRSVRAHMSDVLNGYCAILLGRVLSANVAGRQCKDHECCEQKARWFFWSVPHCNGGGSTFSVSEGSQPPLARQCNLGAIAPTRSFHAVGWADYSSPS